MAIVRWLYVSILSAVVLIMVTAIPIDSFFFRDNISRSIQQSDVLFKMFGQLRHDIAAIFYVKADEYYHGGTRHPSGETHHLEDDIHAEGRDEEHNHPAAVEKNKYRDVFEQVEEEITAHPIIHLQGSASAEIIPWFYLATVFDPQYVQAYTVGGFWLGMQLEKPDAAVAFLREGLRNNPDAWEIYAQLGEMYFTAKQDNEKSAAYLKRAYALIQTSGADDFRKKEILVFLAAAMERLGQLRESLHYYEQLSCLTSDNAVIGKIKALKQKLEGESGNAR